MGDEGMIDDDYPFVYVGLLKNELPHLPDPQQLAASSFLLSFPTMVGGIDSRNSQHAVQAAQETDDDDLLSADVT